MLAVCDTPAAVEWYKEVLGTRLLWNLGSVAGLEIGGAPFFLHEAAPGRLNRPEELGTTTARVEVFVDIRMK
jgi:PhnB protein